MLPSYLYHITDKDKCDRILAEGLKPGKGENSIMVEDELGELVFLCEEKDIPYWSILLGKDSIIKVDTSDLRESDFESFSYGCYGEFYTPDAISCKNVTKVSMFIHKSDAMARLCEEYVISLSDIIVLMTRFGTYPESCSSFTDRIKHDVDSVISIMENRLDFSTLNDSYIVKKLNARGDLGDYTMGDMYCVADRYGKYQLWDQLVHYDFTNDILKQLKDSYTKVHDFVKSNFDWVSNVASGGYTG